jgi:hypothetical protein
VGDGEEMINAFVANYCSPGFYVFLNICEWGRIGFDLSVGELDNNVVGGGIMDALVSYGYCVPNE